MTWHSLNQPRMMNLNLPPLDISNRENANFYL
jgi:hypothetical protein